MLFSNPINGLITDMIVVEYDDSQFMLLEFLVRTSIKKCFFFLFNFYKPDSVIPVSVDYKQILTRTPYQSYYIT